MDRNGLNWVAGASAAGIIAATMAFVQPHEGRVLRTYFDPVGVLTACDGNTLVAIPGAIYTPEECDLLLLADTIHAVIAVEKLVKVEMTDGEWIALSSFVYNLGWRALQRSTLLRLLNAGDRAGAAAQIEKWVHGGGRVLPGLVRRREGEIRVL